MDNPIDKLEPYHIGLQVVYLSAYFKTAFDINWGKQHTCCFCKKIQIYYFELSSISLHHLYDQKAPTESAKKF